MLSAHEVNAAFHAILGREPENLTAVEHNSNYPSTHDLCRALVESEEFKLALRHRFGVLPKFQLDQLDRVAADFKTERKESWTDHVMALPDWFVQTLDPDSDEYREQMLRLWAAITARGDYRASEHEDTPEVSQADAIYRPAFYATGDTRFAGGQLMAMGHILMRSGIRPGDRILEYGAGFGQTALAFARLGATVDTVDINPAFCRVVQESADHFKVDLHSHPGEFGHNPVGENHAYDMVFFYESFHHCLDFGGLINLLPRLLKPHGRVLLAGEPIAKEQVQGLPYPWGFRLDWENVAIMRLRGWMELGFEESYLIRKFAAAGFDCQVHADPNSHWAQIYEFRFRT